jgi:hypothetical protein
MGGQLATHLIALGQWIATNTPKVIAAREKHRLRVGRVGR